MSTQNLPYEHFDPDSDLPDVDRKRRRAEYWAITVFGLLTIPWILGVIAIARAIARLFHH